MEIFTTLLDMTLGVLWAGGMVQTLSRGPFPPAVLGVCTLLWKWESRGSLAAPCLLGLVWCLTYRHVWHAEGSSPAKSLWNSRADCKDNFSSLFSDSPNGNCDHFDVPPLYILHWLGHTKPSSNPWLGVCLSVQTQDPMLGGTWACTIYHLS